MNVTDILNLNESTIDQAIKNINANPEQGKTISLSSKYVGEYFNLIKLGKKGERNKIKTPFISNNFPSLYKSRKTDETGRKIKEAKIAKIIKEFKILTKKKTNNKDEVKALDFLIKKLKPLYLESVEKNKLIKGYYSFEKKRGENIPSSKEYESERVKKEEARKTSGEVKYGDSKTKKLASMMLKNNFDWNFFTTSYYDKDDMSKIIKTIDIPSGKMKIQKGIEVKYMPEKEIKDKTIRFSNFISLSTAPSFMAFYNEYKKISGKEITREVFAKKFNSWVDYIYKNELSSKKGDALIRKIISDNKDKVVQAGGFAKTFEFAAKNAKFSFKKGNEARPGIPKKQKEKYKGIIFPRVKRIDVGITIPKSAYKVENLIDFTREILNG